MLPIVVMTDNLMRIQNPEQIDNYYQALLNRDEAYVGIFYVGVITTGVFCISICRARKPKPENVEFYSTFKDVLNAWLSAMQNL